MATPVGHAIAGLTLGRRLGLTSPPAMAAAVVAAGLPDLDVPAGILLRRDPWKLHKVRGGTHTLGFALASGMLAGFVGLVSAGAAEGERDLVADALAGSLLVSSHLVMDRAPLPYFDVKKSHSTREALRKSAWNWAVDALVYGALAWRFWPRSPAPA
jgi:membrane-bound metal-dependent hydrolase YbcI (DUF457 family)